MRRIEAAPGGPGPVGPYSQAVVANGFVFTSGQIPAHTGIDDQPGTFGQQVRRTIANLEAVLEAAGSGLDRVVKVNTYLTDQSQLQEYNRVYAEYFGSEPARTTVCVTLWGVSLEIECVAVLGNPTPGAKV
jgi:2-iminobutanoate/2-iminopropanoate deaminase